MTKKIKPYVTPMRKKWWAFKKLPNWVRWYILKDYHCDTCPMCWSDYSSYTGDGDCGCYIYGDIREGGCRLIPPIRTLIGWPRKKRAKYAWAHQYDDIGDYYERIHHQEQVFVDCVKQLLNGYILVHRGFDGSFHEISIEEFTEGWGYGSHIGEAYRTYEDAMYPVRYVSLKEDWRKVISLTMQSFTGSKDTVDPATNRAVWDARRKKFSEYCLKMLEWYEVDRRNPNGQIEPVCKVALLNELSFAVTQAICKYNAEAHPVEETSLRDEWKRLIKRTWDTKVKEKIMPYFEK